MAVCGSGEALGDWTVAKCLQLDATDYPTWKAQVAIKEPVEFKYLIARKLLVLYDIRVLHCLMSTYVYLSLLISDQAWISEGWRHPHFGALGRRLSESKIRSSRSTARPASFWRRCVRLLTAFGAVIASSSLPSRTPKQK